MQSSKKSSNIADHLLIFSKSQVNALLATTSDYLTLILLVEYFQMSAVIAAGIGAFIGAIVNFSLNRVFLFKSTASLHVEIAKYSAVSGMSLGLNMAGMWLMTTVFSFNYLIGKTVVSLLVGIFWNYPLHRYWVFRENKKGESALA